MQVEFTRGKSWKFPNLESDSLMSFFVPVARWLECYDLLFPFPMDYKLRELKHGEYSAVQAVIAFLTAKSITPIFLYR